MSQIQVIKRDGNKEPLDLDKLHTVVNYACQDITGVSASEVEIRSHLQFYDGIKSVDSTLLED
jgi:ribonucleoside-diphosphate reductase alpha chain